VSAALRAELFKHRSTQTSLGVFVAFFDETKLINELCIDAYCPISKEPDYKKCAVRVEKA
jgi:nitrate reductase NapA